MDGENVSSKSSTQRESEIIMIENKGEKIEMELRLIKRIHAKDLHAFQQSVEEWSARWQ